MISPKEAVEGFYKAYNAALKGEQLADTDAQSAAALPAHLRFAAESAGKQDALRAKQAQFFGEKAGLVKDDSWKVTDTIQGDKGEKKDGINGTAAIPHEGGRGGRD